MKQGYPKRYIRQLFFVLAVVLVTFYAERISAFPIDFYARSSALSSGRWVKIKVNKSGLYLISNADLQRWGFSDPSKVRIYGYGGNPISDILSSENYVDDLPTVMSETTSRGIVFYGFGPVMTVLGKDGVTYERNYYSESGYYFLSESDTPVDCPTTGRPELTGIIAPNFTEMLYHEQELVSPGSTGHTFLGEDFYNTRGRTFNFNLVDKVEHADMEFFCDFATKVVGSTSRLDFSVNGTEVAGASDNILPASADDSHHHYTMTRLKRRVRVEGDEMSLSLNFIPGRGSVRLARLDRIIVNYSRKLRLSSGLLDFNIDSESAILSDASSETRLWDVTNPAKIAVVNASLSDSKLSWSATTSGSRHYVAWNPDAQMLSPTYVGTVANQDIHSREVPQMIIITMPEWRDKAEEIAEIHRNSSEHPLDVMVVNQDEVFNEFSSGTPHVNAFRRMFKMFWDRGRDGNDSRLQFALLLGRGIYDHRAISQDIKLMNKPVLLQWQTVDGSHDNSSYTTEDYLAFLEDGSGLHPGNDRLCIAIGRIPVTSVNDAALTVEKLKSYMADENKSDWKNRIVLVADDGDGGDHLDQMDKAYKKMMSHVDGRNYMYTKVYVDAFPLVDNVVVEARKRMFRYLNAGSMWWWYTGHANTFSWTGEGLLTREDLDDADFAHQPMMYAATCDFLRWDLKDNSGAEALFFKPNGIIGAIAATRPVYISKNEDMTVAMASKAFDCYDTGAPVPVGEMLRRAKNTMLNNEENKLRYVLLGDPALALATSRNRIKLDRINGEAADPETQPTIKARQEVTMEGRVVDPSGNIVENFNGVFIPTVYDAEFSTTSLAHGKDGKEMTFEEQGDRLYVGRDSIRNGRFNVKISMPAEIASNFRPAAFNMFSFTFDGRDASGVNRDFFVYGYDDSREEDLTPPVIDYFALNSLSFRDGQRVNSSPTVIARVSDNIGINISSAGIGHQISLQLDGSKTYSDVVQFYEPGEDGPLWGTLAYPLTGLSEGSHSLRLRVWDTSNNLAESVISFNVKDGKIPEIINLYADCSPAVDHVNFFVEHNRPGAKTDVTLAVYDLMGRMVWSTKRSGDSANAPMEWNLSDASGRRVPRGIYVYRAVVSLDGEQHASSARKLAVAAN